MPLFHYLVIGIKLSAYRQSHMMNNNNKKRSDQAKEEQQPGDLSSFNNRNVERSTEAERAEEKTRDDGKHIHKQVEEQNYRRRLSGSSLNG